jgi:hypothetical protein
MVKHRVRENQAHLSLLPAQVFHQAVAAAVGPAERSDGLERDSEAATRRAATNGPSSGDDGSFVLSYQASTTLTAPLRAASCVLRSTHHSFPSAVRALVELYALPGRLGPTATLQGCSCAEPANLVVSTNHGRWSCSNREELGGGPLFAFHQGWHGEYTIRDGSGELQSQAHGLCCSRPSELQQRTERTIWGLCFKATASWRC